MTPYKEKQWKAMEKLKISLDWQIGLQNHLKHQNASHPQSSLKYTWKKLKKLEKSNVE